MSFALKDLPDITWRGSASKGSNMDVRNLPRELRKLLTEINGAVAVGGALHVRGNGTQEAWNEIGEVWGGSIRSRTAIRK